MMRATRTGVLLLTISGCGGAPAIVDEGVEIALAPSVGARYDAILETEEQIRARSLDVFATVCATYEVREVDADFVTIHARIDHTRLATRGGAVRLPPATRDTVCEADLRIDRHHGALVTDGELSICAAEAATPWTEPVLPDGVRHVGDTWPMPDGPVWIGIHGIDATRSMGIELASVAGAQAELRWRGTEHAGPFSPREGESITLDVTLEGSASFALSDGMVRSGSRRSTASVETTPEAMRRVVPDAVSLRFCLAADGEAPCEALEPPDDTSEAPMARAYEGDACTARLAAFDATLAALPIPHEDADTREVPAVDHGAQPIEMVAPRVIVSDADMRLDGRVVTIEALQSDLETLQRNWGVLHPQTAFPGRVHVIAAPTVPASALEPLITALSPTLAIDLVVTTGPLPTPPALPAWVGEIPAERTARVSALGRAWANAIAGCPAAIQAFGSLAFADSGQRPMLLRTSMHEALATCGCGGADVDAIEALAARSTSRGEVAVGALVLPAGASGPTIRVSGTVADLAAALANRSTPGAPVRLRFR